MSTKTPTPYDWVKQIPESLLKMDSAPLLGHAPPFSWEQLTQSLQQTFQLEGITIEPSAPEWREESEILTGINGDLAPIHVSVPSMEGTACWVMAKSDIATLMALLLKQETSFAETVDDEMRGGFYEFLALEVIHALEGIEYDQALIPQILPNTELPKGGNRYERYKLHSNSVTPRYNRHQRYKRYKLLEVSWLR